MRRNKTLAVSVLALATLSGCLGNTDLDRAALGAGVGAVGTAVVGGNLAVGAGVGALAGAVCDDVGVCN